MEYPDQHFLIHGYHIIAKRSHSGRYIKAFGLNNQDLDSYLNKIISEIERTDNESTIKRFLDIAVIGYKNSLKKN